MSTGIFGNRRDSTEKILEYKWDGWAGSATSGPYITRWAGGIYTPENGATGLG